MIFLKNDIGVTHYVSGYNKISMNPPTLKPIPVSLKTPVLPIKVVTGAAPGLKVVPLKAVPVLTKPMLQPLTPVPPALAPAPTLAPVPAPTVGAGSTQSDDEYLRGRYKKLELRDHIYQIPDTYIGSIEEDTTKMWLNENNNMVNREVTYIPGLYKIFDEVLVNAIDQHIRMAEYIDIQERKAKGQAVPNFELPKEIGPVKNLKVVINAQENFISVENDGPGIDIEMHPDEKVYIPQLIFSELLTGTNYTGEDEKRIVGGKNGYGAKLCNIFSDEFIIETVDSRRKLYYKQVCRNNMLDVGEPEIKPYRNKPFTRITFRPDLVRFNLPGGLPADTVKIMEKRVWDAAAYTDRNCTVTLNGQRIAVKDFEKYAELFIGTKNKTKRVHTSNSRWEVIACPSWDNDFVQISLVNGISTHRGGKHIDHVTNKICKELAKLLNEKHKAKKVNIKAHHIKKNLCVFVKATIEDPSFDTQTKEFMTTLVSKFGSRCDISDQFIKDLAKTGISEKIMEFYKFKDAQEVKKTDGRKQSRVNVPKLEEGSKPGTRESSKCTLILTEGDSAKSLAISGLGALPEKERQYWGAFPLRGKLLNVREATTKQLLANEEIINMKKILGLQDGKSYQTDAEVQHLRYGRIMIMTDADVDGDHIKGLLFNFFHHFWPSFMKRDSAFCSLITPVVRIWKNMKKGRRVVPNPSSFRNFYTLSEFELWKSGSNGSGWQHKYYKGLGTSTDTEAYEYFKEMKVVDYIWDDQKFHQEANEINRNDYSLNLAFQKNMADDRKLWLADFDPSVVYDYNIDEETYWDFIMKRLRTFSYEDCQRSIPSVCDGLKVSQRKIIYSCLKKKIKKDYKVAQLAGYVAQTAAYHHGENNISGTIVGLAHDYVGSNNMNLLVPSGQFGNRYGGRGPAGSEGLGKNYAAPRYIYTRLNDITPLLFHEHDQSLYKYLEDDGNSIEPAWYLPALPMILVNGSEGIGTGYSCSVPRYKPQHLVENLARLMEGQPPVKMRPWYRGYKGDIIPSGPGKFRSHGVYQVLDNNTVEITEIPVGAGKDTMCLLDYKKFIQSIISGAVNLKADGGEKKTKHPLTGKIVDAVYDLTNNSIKVTLTFAPDTLREFLPHKPEFERMLRLTTNINTTNMHLLDPSGKIKKYDTPEDILKEFYSLRIIFYDERKKLLLRDYQLDYDRASAKAKFIRDVHAGVIKLNDPKPQGGVKPRPKSNIIEQLQILSYPMFHKMTKKPWEFGYEDTPEAAVLDPAAPVDETQAVTPLEPDLDPSVGYTYLFSLHIEHLTEEKIKKLEEERDIALDKLDTLKGKTPQMLWKEDLTDLMDLYKDLNTEWYDVANITPGPDLKLVKKTVDIKFRPAPAKRIITITRKN